MVTAVLINCWLQAATTFGVPPTLLYAISEVESSHRPDAFARAPNGTYSVGTMQINSSWFPKLRAMGIQERSLWHLCVNIHVGAWILSQEVVRYGYSWEAIGAYYAGPYDDTTRSWKLKHYQQYARKVLTRWKVLESKRSSAEITRGLERPKRTSGTLQGFIQSKGVTRQ